MIASAYLATISDDPVAISVPLEVEAGQGRAGRHIMDPHPLLTPLVPSGHFTHAGGQEQLSGCSSGLHSRFLTPFLLHLRLLRPRHLPGLWGDIFPHPLYIGQLQIPGWSSLHIKNILALVYNRSLAPRVHDCVRHTSELYCSLVTYIGVTLSPLG